MVQTQTPNTGSTRTHDAILAGETVQLLAGRAMHWPRQRTLFIADSHFGKSAAFRSIGIAAPESTDADLIQLDKILVATCVGRLVVLGDFFHARAGRSPSVLTLLKSWRARQPQLEIILVRGNHDHSAGDPPPDLNIQCVREPWHIGPFVCCHQPCESEGGYVLSGHIHPGIALRERGGAGLRTACFVIGARRAILPAFGSFTGLGLIDPQRGDRFFAVNEDTVVAI